MKVLKIILSVLFLVCLLKMPYGFYELLRIVALISFSLLAYHSFNQKNINLTIIYVGLSILFQPIFKIVLGRTLWNITDIIVALFLIFTLINPTIEDKIKEL